MSAVSGFKKAERKQVKLKLGLAGPSGSGKTYSALKLAKGLMDAAGSEKYRIALIDTENRSASLYADLPGLPSFDTLELEPPYTVDKYIAAIELAIKEKYDLLIVDSVSHVWSGEGGLLQEKENLDARGGNSYTNWAKMTPKWNRFVSEILHSDVHMICTMRSKQEHALGTNANGKTEVKKMGMAPQVREGFEYELTAVFDMDMSHQAQASKDRTSLFNGRTWQPDEKTGAEIHAWLNMGKPADPKVAALTQAQVELTKLRTAELQKAVNPVTWPTGSVVEYCTKAFGTAKLSELAEPQFAALLLVVKLKTASQARVDLASAQERPTPPQEASQPSFDDATSHG